MRGRWAAGAALAGVLASAACSGGSTPATHASSTSGGTRSPSAAATRWWSNTAATAGSTLSAGVDEAAARLQPSRTEYCAMLRDTVAAGKSILPNVTAHDPALLTTASAFVAEVKAVAPAEVSAQWKTLGTAVVAIVKSGGNLKDVPELNSSGVQQAASAVAADAKSRCNLDLATAKG